MKKYIITLGFIGFSLINYAQQSLISQEIKENIKARVDAGENISIAVGYFEGNEIEYFNYGKTAITNGISVNENTVYEIGSVSKVFTTILLADEVLKSNMSLSDPISQYLPNSINIPSRKGKQITLKHLATHTSGLPRLPNNLNTTTGTNPYINYSKEQMYSFLSGYKLQQNIGETYRYSNYGMGLLGHILELQSGKRYEDLLIQKIANEYSMNDTRVTLSNSMKSRLAKGYFNKGEIGNWDIGSLVGAGGIRSTIKDMIKFIRGNASKVNTPINKAMQMTHQLAFVNKQDGNREVGLAWFHSRDKKSLFHNGATGGYEAFVTFTKDGKKGVVVLTNSRATDASINDIAINLLGIKVSLHQPKGVKEITTKGVSVPIATLNKYLGKFELAPNYTMNVTREGGNLFVQLPNQAKFNVLPTSQTEFYVEVVKARIVFNVNAVGDVESLTLYQDGQTVKANKIL